MTRMTGDEERVARIKANGHVCLARLHGDQTWEDWTGVGVVMDIITEEALQSTNTTEWDQKKNKKAVKEFDRLWNAYEAEAGTNHKPLSSQERWALRTVMSNEEIRNFRDTLTGPEKRRLNHPNAVINRWKAREKAKAVPAEDKPLSPQAKLKAANIELQEELHQLKKNGDGSLFSVKDKPKDIANTVIGTFDGQPKKLSMVESVVRELQAWLKAQKKKEAKADVEKKKGPPKSPAAKRGNKKVIKVDAAIAQALANAVQRVDSSDLDWDEDEIDGYPEFRATATVRGEQFACRVSADVPDEKLRGYRGFINNMARTATEDPADCMQSVEDEIARLIEDQGDE